MSSIPILNSVLYPAEECLTLPPVNYFYYPLLFTLDTSYMDFCSNLSLSEHIISNFQNNKQSDQPFTTCSDLLCSNSTIILDLTNTTQVESLGQVMNFCLYCNHSSSDAFRNLLWNGQCQTFTSLHSLQNGNFGPQFVNMMNLHCNGDRNTQLTVPSQHLPIFDVTFFKTEYFKRQFSKYQLQSHSTNEFETASPLKRTTLQSLLNFYFGSVMTQENISSTNIPFDIPVTCWCHYNDPSSHSFGFQCNDFYHNFLIPYSFRYSPLISAVVFILIFFIHLFTIQIPRFYERIYTFKHKIIREVVDKSIFMKMNITIQHFLDIVVQAPVCFSLSLLSGFLENMFRFLFNFSFMFDFYQGYLAGLFRALSGVLVVCGFSSLVISWSHAIDVSNHMRQDKSNALSIFNKTILSIFYAAVVLVLITSGIVFAVVSDYGYAWSILALSVMIYIFTYGFGFLFYGIRIYFRLRKANNKGGLFEYRFTKFMLGLSIWFFYGWICTMLSMITYIFGFDVLSLFFGMTRNIFLDSSLILVTILSSYITFNKEAFVKSYGKKAFYVLCFWELFSNNSTNEKSREFMAPQNLATNSRESSSFRRMSSTVKQSIEISKQIDSPTPTTEASSSTSVNTCI
ncbi:hypothetical protein C9374_013417 [Naegleria lovaniensis]|uniref:Uncharacterized protein n=1 Tax=Naegleria lovaniensis TaxID=51637 RepID=A0AA88KCV5_NAELO|nr:uncharacterized protein C9374_013829 [Naegleria lovaniensis]XP_044553826.1 uncharacterized protein C9374_013417 [Naegleria lovaniensis]KAG2370825.1 hypothetical protein C9374_013829 [Naegleria lovaniensis]KAG2391932.1 hypothetical protein C9374_013417 [Naegleria lovaniensis]